MVEDIILQHSNRGMDKLQKYLPADYCEQAAKAVYAWERGSVFLTTGFYVAGAPETDGPPGLMVLAKTLRQLGFSVVVVTDIFCEGLFDELEDVVYVPIRPEPHYFERLILKYHPVGMISIERCGKNTEGDYANMRGISIAQYTASIDCLFELAATHQIPTVGIGDGGNEIGMGVLKQQITEQLSLVPCVVPVDYLVIATVSNWGAYGLAACLASCYVQQHTSGQGLGRKHKSPMPTEEWLRTYLEDIVEKGAVDGVIGKPVVSVDGFPADIEFEIFRELLAS